MTTKIETRTVGMYDETGRAALANAGWKLSYFFRAAHNLTGNNGIILAGNDAVVYERKVSA